MLHTLKLKGTLSELRSLMSYLKAIDRDDFGVALPLFRLGFGGLDRRRRHGRFVHGEVDDLQDYVKHVQLVEAECAREAVLCF